MEISKQDWALYRAKLPDWQEQHMEQLNHEYLQILNSSQPASDKFWALEERIRQDKNHPGVIVERSRSKMIPTLVTLVRDQVISMEDLSEFSEDVRHAVSVFARW